MRGDNPLIGMSARARLVEGRPCQIGPTRANHARIVLWDVTGSLIAPGAQLIWGAARGAWVDGLGAIGSAAGAAPASGLPTGESLRETWTGDCRRPVLGLTPH